jgi:hypothetical protein
MMLKPRGQDSNVRVASASSPQEDLLLYRRH